jgi:hypothetical protein
MPEPSDQEAIDALRAAFRNLEEVADGIDLRELTFGPLIGLVKEVRTLAAASVLDLMRDWERQWDGEDPEREPQR